MKLHGLELSDTKLIADGVYEGRSVADNMLRLHNCNIYLGYAHNWVTHKRGQCWRATAWNREQTVEIKKLYPTQAAADKGLRRMAVKLFGGE